MALEFFVDPVSGDDLAPGTPADPWRTLAKMSRFLGLLNADGQEVRVWLGKGIHHERIELTNGPLNLKSSVGVDSLVIEGDGLPSEVVINSTAPDWAIRNMARAKFRSIRIVGVPGSGGVLADSRMTQLDDIEFENVPNPIRVMEFSRFEGDDLRFIGTSDEFLSVYGNAVAEIGNITFDGWEYGETFFRFSGDNASVVADDFDFSGASFGPNTIPYEVTRFSSLTLNGMTIPAVLAGVVNPDGRVYA